jgi:hypothetical protein
MRENKVREKQITGKEKLREETRKKMGRKL